MLKDKINFFHFPFSKNWFSSHKIGMFLFLILFPPRVEGNFLQRSRSFPPNISQTTTYLFFPPLQPFQVINFFLWLTGPSLPKRKKAKKGPKQTNWAGKQPTCLKSRRVYCKAHETPVLFLFSTDFSRCLRDLRMTMFGSWFGCGLSTRRRLPKWVESLCVRWLAIQSGCPANTRSTAWFIPPHIGCKSSGVTLRLGHISEVGQGWWV